MPAFGAVSTVKWAWHSHDERVKWFRYQLNAEKEDGWTVVDSNITSDIFPDSEGNILYVQASFDGINWSASGCATNTVEESAEKVAEKAVEKSAEKSAEESKRSNALRISVTPYSQALFRFYNGYNTSSTRTKTRSLYGFASSVEVALSLSSWLSISPELSYDIIIKESTVVPGARNVQYLKAGVVLDFTFDVTEKTSAYVGLFTGAMAHVNNKKASITPYFGARLGFDHNLEERFSLGALSRVSLAFFAGRSSRLMDSMTILIDPVSLTFTYRF